MKICKSRKSLQSVVFSADRFLSGISSLEISVYWLFLQSCPRKNLALIKHTLFLQYSCFSRLLLCVAGLEEPCPQLSLRKRFRWLLLRLCNQWQPRRLSAFVHLYLFYVLRETPPNVWFHSQIKWRSRGSSSKNIFILSKISDFLKSTGKV